ncbi:hypothetical protein EYZ11_002500 [Aspergillus tanneri]|uniref:Uncharacterized protein n=1 Tax=Aspergillus tanneri TaxID=1220188 RepID=A0A4S3JSN8_9EURO|nr:hypothetical protein EYZ11_002500 [Aspergillus tanneri]
MVYVGPLFQTNSFPKDGTNVQAPAEIDASIIAAVRRLVSLGRGYMRNLAQIN